MALLRLKCERLLEGETEDSDVLLLLLDPLLHLARLRKHQAVVLDDPLVGRELELFILGNVRPLRHQRRALATGPPPVLLDERQNDGMIVALLARSLVVGCVAVCVAEVHVDALHGKKEVARVDLDARCGHVERSTAKSILRVHRAPELDEALQGSHVVLGGGLAQVLGHIVVAEHGALLQEQLAARVIAREHGVLEGCAPPAILGVDRRAVLDEQSAVGLVALRCRDVQSSPPIGICHVHVAAEMAEELELRVAARIGCGAKDLVHQVLHAGTRPLVPEALRGVTLSVAQSVAQGRASLQVLHVDVSVVVTQEQDGVRVTPAGGKMHRAPAIPVPAVQVDRCVRDDVLGHCTVPFRACSAQPGEMQIVSLVSRGDDDHFQIRALDVFLPIREYRGRRLLGCAGLDRQPGLGGLLTLPVTVAVDLIVAHRAVHHDTLLLGKALDEVLEGFLGDGEDDGIHT
mmetsp:Transcript_17747/g.51618  ORF Transcript_17747/g.51618 Transcript_17747/m.51618 type:complete len:461 (+) Transcript_17747:695-2077(+)